MRAVRETFAVYLFLYVLNFELCECYLLFKIKLSDQVM